MAEPKNMESKTVHTTEELVKRSLTAARMSALFHRRVMENEELDIRDRKYLMEQFKNTLEKPMKENEARLSHARNYLRKKGMLGNGTGITGLIEQVQAGLSAGSETRASEAVALGTAVTKYIPAAPFTKEAINAAIELTAWLFAPDVLFSGAHYAHILKERYPEFCLLLCLCEIITCAETPIGMHEYLHRQTGEVMEREKRLDEIDGSIDDLEAFTWSILNENARLEQEIRDLKGEGPLAELTLANEQIASLKEKLRKKDAVIEKQKGQLNKMPAVPAEDHMETAAISDAEEPVKNPLPELPETGVAFFGGHTNLVKKIRERHPGWKFYDEDNLATMFPKDLKDTLAILYTEHMPHKLFYAYMKNRTDTTRQIFASGTNLDRLETGIREDLQALLPKEKMEKEADEA